MKSLLLEDSLLHQPAVMIEEHLSIYTVNLILQEAKNNHPYDLLQ